MLPDIDQTEFELKLMDEQKIEYDYSYTSLGKRYNF